MASVARLIVKALTPRIAMKALALLDKSTAVVVSACWTAALVTLILAVTAVHGAISAKREAANAVAIEPVLPVVSTSAISPVEGKAILDRLQRQFPDIRIEMDSAQSISVKSSDGARYHEWLTALSSIDTLAPKYRWTLRDFCVGKCGQDLMRAMAVGQKVTFALPPPK